MMDGFAVCSKDIQKGKAYDVRGEIMAGHEPSFEMTPGTVVRITTGAPVPEGADAVIKVEDSTLLTTDTEQVSFSVTVATGKAIRPIGCDVKPGQRVMDKGTRLGAAEIGLLACVGVSRVQVYRRPRIAVLSTGDELVPCDQEPKAGKIRDSNGPMLMAAVKQYCGYAWPCVDLGIATGQPFPLPRPLRIPNIRLSRCRW